MNRVTSLCLTLVALLGLAGTARAQLVIWSQPNDDPDGECSSVIYDGFCEERLADNFMLSNATYREITEVTCWGSSDYYEHIDLSNFSHWTITIYDQVEGLPGYILYETTVAIEDVDCVPTGNENFWGGFEYQQTFTLPDPPTLYIDEPYWISIAAHEIEPWWDVWLWSLNFNDGDDLFAVDLYDGWGYRARTGDLAFVLVADPASGCPRAGDSGKGCSADIHPNNGNGVWDSGDGNCVVDLNDLAQLLGRYGITSGATREDGDIYPPGGGDGVVDLSDLAELAGQYGEDCRE
jgi:hypothetical protein